MNLDFPRATEPIAEGGKAPMARSWLQWLRTFVTDVAANVLRYIGLITFEPTGIEDRTASTIAFDGATRTFTISPISTSFRFFIWGQAFTKTSAQTVVIPDTTGTHYIYFDSDGDLVSSTSSWAFDDEKAFVALVYWRAGESAGILMDERHGIAMDWATHEYLHETVSMRYVSGLAGTFNATNTFSIASGEVHDEDLNHAFTTQTNCRILYRDGAGAWKFGAGSTGYYLESGGGVIQYDDGDGTTADVTHNRYVAYWIFASNDLACPIWSIVGQREDTTLANARANAIPTAIALTGLPSPELKLLYRVIIRRNNAAEVIEDVTDYRNISSLPVGSYVATDHTSLSNLNSAGYYHLTQTDHTDLTDAGQTSLHKHDHNAQDNLTTGDVHTHYALLAGRSGGQSLTGGTSSGDDLTLNSTSDGTKGDVLIQTAGGNVAIGTVSPETKFHVESGGTSDVNIARFLSASANDNTSHWVSIGKAASANQALAVGHHYDSDGATSSYSFLTTYGDNIGVGINLKYGGNVGINVTNPGCSLQVYEYAAATPCAFFRNDGDNANRYGIAIQAGKNTPTSNGDCVWVQFYDGDYGYYSYIGFSTSAPYAAFYSASDERLKKNIKPTAVAGIDTLKRIELKEFDWKDPKRHHQTIGYIAQQLEQAYPAMVARGEDGYLSVSDACLIPVLVKAVQELSSASEIQQSQIAILRTQVADLERQHAADVTALHNEINELRKAIAALSGGAA